MVGPVDQKVATVWLIVWMVLDRTENGKVGRLEAVVLGLFSWHFAQKRML